MRFGAAVVAALPVLLTTPASARAASPGWVNTGPLGAPIYQLALSGDNPSTIYGASGYLVWRSNDGGQSWVATHPGFLYEMNDVENIGVSGQNPNVVYAGSFQSLRKTTDGGRTWFDIMNGLPSHPDAEDVAVDPTNDLIAYVGGAIGLYKTTDGGEDWTPADQGLNRQGGFLIAIDPTAPSTLYTYTGGGAEIYKTIDGGGHWFASGTGIPPYPETEGLVVDPNNDQNVFVTVLDDVYHSYDGGGHWSPSASGVATAYLRSLAVSKAEPNTLYAGVSDLYMTQPRGVFKSTDAGMTWHSVTGAFKGSALAVDPSTAGHIYAGTGNYQNDDLGVFETTDGGSHWHSRVRGMIGTDTRSLVVAPTDELTAYAATNGDPGVYRTNDGGRSWAFAGGRLPEPTDALGVAPTDPDIVYAGLYADEPLDTHAGVYKSADGGRTWQPANQGIADREVLSLVVDPTNADVVYTGVVDYCGSECDGGSLWKTTDGGASWFESDSGAGGHLPSSLAISKSDPQTLYFVDSSFVFRTEDAGQSWVLAGDLPISFTAAALAVDPADPTHLYAAGWGGIAKSTDSGASWTILPNSPSQSNDVAVPAFDQLCAGSLKGVSCSRDGGTTWAQVGGLNGVITEVAVGSGGLLYAGSYDHGVAVHPG